MNRNSALARNALARNAIKTAAKENKNRNPVIVAVERDEKQRRPAAAAEVIDRRQRQMDLTATSLQPLRRTPRTPGRPPANRPHQHDLPDDRRALGGSGSCLGKGAPVRWGNKLYFEKVYDVLHYADYTPYTVICSKS